MRATGASTVLINFENLFFIYPPNHASPKCRQVAFAKCMQAMARPTWQDVEKHQYGSLEPPSQARTLRKSVSLETADQSGHCFFILILRNSHIQQNFGTVSAAVSASQRDDAGG